MAGYSGQLCYNQANQSSLIKFPKIYLAAPICHPENQDILFLVDGSSRIGRTEFIAGQRFIKRLVEKMTIGKNTTHIGIMQFGSAGRVEHATRLGSDNVRSTVSNDVSKMVYMNERYDSDLGYALSIASDMVMINN